MQRFFFPHLPLGKDLTMQEESFIHQISRVLRSHIGAEIVLFNGDGYEYIYAIHSIEKKEIRLSFVEKTTNMSDSEVLIRLYQSLPNKYEKIEYILQKGVEIWVREFVFFRSERSQNLVINNRKIERFNEIIKEATEQCYWNKLATLNFLEDKLPTPQDGISYVLHTEGTDSQHLREISIDSPIINLFIGPEGGWSEGEISIFKERSIQKIHLWNRILRTETTGTVVAFFLLNK